MSDSTGHTPPREGGPSRDGDAEGASEPPPETSDGIPVYAAPDEFAIQVVRLGINRGVQKQVHTAGLNLVTPGMQQMYRLPRDVQVLELLNLSTHCPPFVFAPQSIR
ncbi:MAG: hypothetical protein KFF68_01040 [Desulfosarcina sp.]|nr:hypothetical protein [Desulfosarcina sp.]